MPSIKDNNIWIYFIKDKKPSLFILIFHHRIYFNQIYIYLSFLISFKFDIDTILTALDTFAVINKTRQEIKRLMQYMDKKVAKSEMYQQARGSGQVSEREAALLGDVQELLASLSSRRVKLREWIQKAVSR